MKGKLPMLKLEQGKRYVCRDGSITNPMKEDIQRFHMEDDSEEIVKYFTENPPYGFLYEEFNENGVAYVYFKDQPHEKDLIKEYIEESS